MFRTTFVLLAMMACAQARPRQVHRGAPQASGQSDSGTIKSETSNPFGGTSSTSHQESKTGGQASHGGFNVGSASTDTQNLQASEGISSTVNTDARSEQGSHPGSHFGGGPIYRCPPPPAGWRGQQFVPIPHGGGGSAGGHSGSTISKGENITPFGLSTVTQQQSSTGGEASRGGTNVGTASSDTQSQSGLHGTSSSENTDARSSQFSNSNLPAGGGPVRPIGPIGHDARWRQPVFHGGFDSSAKGNSVSNIARGESVDPQGGVFSNVEHRSVTGGEARHGGTSIGTASTNAQSLQTSQGISSTSNTGAESVQDSNPGGFPIEVYRNCPGFGGGFGSGGGFGFGGFDRATGRGHSGSGISREQTFGPHGAAFNVVRQEASTGGQASHGGTNVGTASTDAQSLNTPHGISSSSNTDAESFQGSHPAFHHFGGGVGDPRFPLSPGFGSAAGLARSESTESDSVGPDGSRNKVTVLGSSAGGDARDGGTSVSRASGSTSSTDGVGGSQTQSHLDSTSIQTSGR